MLDVMLLVGVELVEDSKVLVGVSVVAVVEVLTKAEILELLNANSSELLSLAVVAGILLDQDKVVKLLDGELYVALAELSDDPAPIAVVVGVFVSVNIAEEV